MLRARFEKGETSRIPGRLEVGICVGDREKLTFHYSQLTQKCQDRAQKEWKRGAGMCTGGGESQVEGHPSRWGVLTLAFLRGKWEASRG